VRPHLGDPLVIVLGLILALALCGYLVYALLRAEEF
jgi:K+-transporting ATPase KdpF subunit